jgi:hypothetical protein
MYNPDKLGDTESCVGHSMDKLNLQGDTVGLSISSDEGFPSHFSMINTFVSPNTRE